MQELGTPKEAAYDILDNLISEKKKDPGTPVWKIILLTFLAICAAPLGGSLLIAVIAVALAGVLVIIAGLLCIFALGAASVIIGGKLFFRRSSGQNRNWLFLRGAVAITASLSGASLISGAGLFSIGLGILAVLAVIYFCKWVILGLAHLIQNMSRKRSVK